MAIEVDYVEVSKPLRYMSREEFSQLYNGIKALGGRRIGDYRWAVPVYAILGNPEVFINVKKYGVVDIPQNAPGWFKDILERLGEIQAKYAAYMWMDGNTLFILFRDGELADAFEQYAARSIENGGLTAVREVYDPAERRRVTKTYPFYTRYGRVFKTYRGFGPRVLRILSELGVEDTNAGELKFIDVHPNSVTIPLRDYQSMAVNEALNQLTKWGAATIQAATGSGKTEMGLAIAQAVDGQVLVVVPTRDLAYQWLERAGKYGIKAGVAFGDTVNVPDDARVLITTNATAYKAAAQLLSESNVSVQSLPEEGGEEESEGEEEVTEEAWRRVEDWMRKARLVEFDEAHHLPARTVRLTALATPNAAKLGLSATPWRNDKWDAIIYAYAGEVAAKVTSSDLIKRGYLAPAFIYMLNTHVSGDYGNYQLEKSSVLKNPERLRLLAEVVKTVPHPVLVLVGETKVGEEALQALRKLAPDLRVKFIHGKVDAGERAKILDEVRGNLVDVLLATTLADEGLDIPGLRTLVLYFPGKSSTRIYQRIGRVLRTAEGKYAAVVVDFVDESAYFSEHALEREKLYEQEPEWKLRKINNIEELVNALNADINYAKSISEEKKRNEYIVKNLIARGWKPTGNSLMIKINEEEPKPETTLEKTWVFGPFDVDAYRLIDGEVEQVWVFRRKRGKERNTQYA